MTYTVMKLVRLVEEVGTKPMLVVDWGLCVEVVAKEPQGQGDGHCHARRTFTKEVCMKRLPNGDERAPTAPRLHPRKVLNRLLLLTQLVLGMLGVMSSSLARH